MGRTLEEVLNSLSPEMRSRVEQRSDELIAECEKNPNTNNLYEQDYLQWIEATLQQLRSRNYENVDWENLLAEIEDMGKRDRRSLESNLVIVLLHLLKWQFQPEHRTGSWSASIAEHRRRIAKLLKDSPSSIAYIDSIFAECYEDAREQAYLETGLPQETFPINCPYQIADVLDRQFWPE
jgi:Domain of unknown function DUF29